MKAMALRHLGRTSEAIRSYEQAVAIYRRLADSSPSVTSYKAVVAAILNYIGGTYRERGDYANGVLYTYEAMDLFRALRPDQAGGAEFASHVAECDTTLALCDLGMGRLDEATRRVRRCVFHLERADRAHPGGVLPASPNQGLGGLLPASPDQGLGGALIQLAVVELSAGEAREACRAAERVREVVGRSLRSNPNLRHVRHWKALGLLVESLLDLQEGQAREASRAADEAAAELEGLKRPLLHQEHFDLGLAHALFYAAGPDRRRPDGIPIPHDHGTGR
jgi:tetratricopeptide (TPR) repeat protein